MWIAERESVGSDVEKVRILSADRTLSFAETIAGWRDDDAFRAFFIAALAATPFDAFFWEMPPIRQSRLHAPYEYVAVRSETLARLRADASAFASKFSAAEGASVVSFPNLGGDARLLVPRPLGAARAYTHLAAFVRKAPMEQSDALLRSLACSIESMLGDDNLWISTSGLGVAWVHVRLDSFPKYYQHAPYARPDA